MLRLVLEYLSPRSSVLDVGCGAGAYGPAPDRGGSITGPAWKWIPTVYNYWSNAACHFAERREERERFPCGNEEFDEAICIEVLEHIERPERFLGEISRIICRRALFSVPNIEVIPYFKDWETVPWHMLEGDHKNFFTRTSLHELLAFHFPRVEVFFLQ